MNILIVDDDEITRVKLSKVLSAYGTCTEADDGQMALCVVGYAKGCERPFDLITMDIDMPGLRGQDVVKAIRKWEAGLGIAYPSPDSVKIIMLTAMDTLADVSQAYKEYCDDYIVKPITPDNIRTSLKKIGLAKAN